MSITFFCLFKGNISSLDRKPSILFLPHTHTLYPHISIVVEKKLIQVSLKLNEDSKVYFSSNILHFFQVGYLTPAPV